MSSNTGLTYFAVSLAFIAALLGGGGVLSAISADNHAKTVDARVDSVVTKHGAFVNDISERFKTVSVALAEQATSIVVLDNAVAKLQTKAEQSVVDRLADELRTNKASRSEVRDIASQLLAKADAKTVKALSSRMGKLDGRVVKLEGVVFPKPISGVVMDQPAPGSFYELKPVDGDVEITRRATLPAGQALKAEAARINALNPPVQPTSAKSPAPPTK